MRLLVCVLLAIAWEVTFSPRAADARVEDRHWMLWKLKNARNYAGEEDAIRYELTRSAAVDPER